MGLVSEIDDKNDAFVRTIGWIDNTISKFQQFIESFAQFGSKVCWSVSPSDFLLEFSSEDIDHLLLDYDLLGSTGFDHLEQILSRCSVKNVYICTAYSYDSLIIKKCEEASARFQKQISIIPKEFLPYADQPEDVKDFLAGLDSGEFVDFTPGVMLHTNAGIKGNYPTFENYRSMALIDRLRLLENSRDEHSDKIETAFADGKVWLLLDAHSGEIIQSESDSTRILTGDEVDELSEKQELILFSFSKGWSLDSIDNQCNGPDDLKNYGVLSLSIPIPEKTTADLETKTKRELYEFATSPEYLHYDNGNSFSLFGYEFFLEKGWLRTLNNPGMREQGDLRLYGKEIVLKDAIVADSRGDSASGDVRGFAAMNWLEHRVALTCTQSCKLGTLYPPARSVLLCNRRKALLGRNIKREINRGLTEDISSSRMALVRDPFK